MVKVNFVTARHKRRKKVLKLAKGYFGSKSNLYKTANEQVMRSLQYAYRDRKQKKRNFRKLWITRINAGCKNNNMRYSEFIHGLLLAKVEVNRKILSDMSCNHPEMFIDYIKLSQRSLKEEKNNIKEIKQNKEVIEKQEKQKVLKEEENNIKEIKQNKEVVEKQETQKVNNKQAVKKEDISNLDSVKTEKQENKSEDIEKKLENTLLSELKILAKKYEIKNINKFKKSDLISLLKEKMLI
ncbi:50S ribosomal protein L20 ['Camptotheca acuminata' phytoplasma]|uniref:50S ribosomal protein L20 n=1 Tax='Camptotheca acuminata' phytoplasma TaxID=3239192 RepID=UPI00351A6AAC